MMTVIVCLKTRFCETSSSRNTALLLVLCGTLLACGKNPTTERFDLLILNGKSSMAPDSRPSPQILRSKATRSLR
jgi:hypothetical protein